jgi:DNA-binding MarR family transcriptional regulator
MAEPRWLDITQQQDWRAFIDGTVRLLGVIDRDLKRRHNLSLPEYEILVRLSEAPDLRVRMAELAGSANHSRSRLSHAVARLELRGLVRRASCPQDRRGVYAHLTDDGMSVLGRAARDHVNVVRDYFVDVVDPTDLNAIGRAFRLVLERIDDVNAADGDDIDTADTETDGETGTGTDGDRDRADGGSGLGTRSSG